MYRILKSLLFAVFSEKWLAKWKFVLRTPFILLFAGNKHYCPVEQRSYRKFIDNFHIDHIEKLSPYSGLLPRQRLLWLLLQQKVGFKEPVKVLHFSPNPYFSKSIKAKTNWNYFTTDYLDSTCDYQWDITQMDCENEVFDIIICYHVLEHITQDDKAFTELYRILNKGGICFLQTPFKLGETLEDSNFNTAELRLLHYNQADHVRLYGLDSFREKLISNGFTFQMLSVSEIYHSDEIFKMGLNSDEIVFLAEKN